MLAFKFPVLSMYIEQDSILIEECVKQHQKYFTQLITIKIWTSKGHVNTVCICILSLHFSFLWCKSRLLQAAMHTQPETAVCLLHGLLCAHLFSCTKNEFGQLLSCLINVKLHLLPLSPHRLKVAVDSVDPRIHFALVCGAKSCPPIRTYSASVWCIDIMTLYGQIDNANFLRCSACY